MLHGGLGHGGNWGYQVPALTSSGYRAVLIDSRGHGHNTRDERRYRYELMASDVLAEMDHLQVEKAAFVGWSDGACSRSFKGSMMSSSNSNIPSTLPVAFRGLNSSYFRVSAIPHHCKGRRYSTA